MSKDKKRVAQQVGRVDFRLLMANRAEAFADKRTKRNRTRGDARRTAIREAWD